MKANGRVSFYGLSPPDLLVYFRRSRCVNPAGGIRSPASPQASGGWGGGLMTFLMRDRCKNNIPVKKRCRRQDVKRVCGDKSRHRYLCVVKKNHVISAAELISHFLSLPAAPGCSTSLLQNVEDLLLL